MTTKLHNRNLEGSSVNVKDFGAVGDGVTDDTAAIQATLNAGLRVDVPSGEYLISATIAIPEGVNIQGVRNQVFFLRTSGFTGSMFIVRSSNTIRDCVFNGQASSAGSGNSLSIDGKAGITIEGCSFLNSPNDGILCSDSKRIVVRDCTTLNNFRNGMSFTDSIDTVSVSGIRCTGDDVAGIDFEPNSTISESLTVQDVVISNTALSIQGGGTANYNQNISISDVRILDGGVFNMNRAEQVAIANLFISEDSDVTIDNQQTANTFGQTNGSIHNCYGKFLNVGYSKILNGDFENSDTNWTVVKTGTSDTVEIVNNQGLYGNNEAHIAQDMGSNVAFYVSDSFMVSAGQQVTAGGVIRPVSGRPYILVQFRNGTTVLEEYKTGPNFVNPDFNKAKNYFMSIAAPTSTDNARVYIGCSSLSGALSEGYFDGVFAYVDSVKTGL